MPVAASPLMGSTAQSSRMRMVRSSFMVASVARVFYPRPGNFVSGMDVYKVAYSQLFARDLPFSERGNLPLERLHYSGKLTDELRAQFAKAAAGMISHYDCYRLLSRHSHLGSRKWPVSLKLDICLRPRVDLPLELDVHGGPAPQTFGDGRRGSPPMTTRHDDVSALSSEKVARKPAKFYATSTGHLADQRCDTGASRNAVLT
jgi:hypothetical protein